MSAIQGLRGTGDFGVDERPKSFREMILWRRPNGTAPITALLSKAKKETVTDPDFSWWDEPVDIVRLQINGALSSSDTTVTVDSADPDANTPNRVWGVAKHLVPGDILQVEPATEVAAYAPEFLLVTAIQSDTAFTVSRAFAGTSAASIANDLFLLKVGNAYGEGTAEPASASRNPIKYQNFCQIFKTSYEVTGTTKATTFRTGDAIRNEKMRKSKDHSIALEQSILWGQKSEATDTNGKLIRTTDGLRNIIPSTNTKVYTSTVTITNLLDDLSKAFDYESDAGDVRIGFCGNSALNAINKIIKNDSATRITFNEKIKFFGMNLSELSFPQGRILLRTHPLMNRHAVYTKSLFLVDFSALRWRHTAGRDTHFQDNIQAKGEDVIRGQWFTEGGLEYWYGGLTMAYLGNIVA